MITKFKKKYIHSIRLIFLTLYGLFIIPSPVYASTVVGRIIGSACDWLSGEIGAGIGTLVVIYSGFQMVEGHIETKTLVSRGVGVGIIIGGAYIAKNIFGIGG